MSNFNDKNKIYIERKIVNINNSCTTYLHDAPSKFMAWKVGNHLLYPAWVQSNVTFIYYLQELCQFLT